MRLQNWKQFAKSCSRKAKASRLNLRSLMSSNQLGCDCSFLFGGGNFSSLPPFVEADLATMKLFVFCIFWNEGV